LTDSPTRTAGKIVTPNRGRETPRELVARNAEPLLRKMEAMGFTPAEVPSAILAATRKAFADMKRVRFFDVGNLRVRPEDEANPLPIVVETPTLFGLLRVTVMCLVAIGQVEVETLRREITKAKETARDRCLTAIARSIALTKLDALLKLAAALAVEILGFVRPELPPRVLSAGGQTQAYSPLT
jgi:hypothetical protein